MHELILIILDNYKEEIKVVEESNLNDFNNIENGPRSSENGQFEVFFEIIN